MHKKVFSGLMSRCMIRCLNRKETGGTWFRKIAKRLGSFAGFSRPRWHLCMWCNASPIWKKIAHTCEAGCKRKPRNCQQQQGPNQNDTNREHHQQKGTWCSCSIRSVCFSLPHAALSGECISDPKSCWKNAMQAKRLKRLDRSPWAASSRIMTISLSSVKESLLYWDESGESVTASWTTAIHTSETHFPHQRDPFAKLSHKVLDDGRMWQLLQDLRFRMHFSFGMIVHLIYPVTTILHDEPTI